MSPSKGIRLRTPRRPNCTTTGTRHNRTGPRRDRCPSLMSASVFTRHAVDSYSGGAQSSGSARFDLIRARLGLRAPSDAFQPRIRVAETLQLHAHPVHQRQIQAAQLPVVVALVQIVEAPAGLE